MECPPNGFMKIFILSVFLLVPANAALIFPKEAIPTKTGYLPINSNSSSSIYFAFYEAQKPVLPLPQTPLLVWLQGGPGCSSMIGNFFELGPWRVANSNSLPVLKPNPGAWNHMFGLVFLDNPIGTGFSIAATTEEIPRDQETVAKHLFIALKSFILLNPSFKSRPIYITGESYAGKYVPAIGSYILQQNSRLPLSRKVNLKGVAIGNGLTDPEIQVTTHAITGYYTGLINAKQKKQLAEMQTKAVSLTRAGKWIDAVEARGEVLDNLQNMTGLATLYDLRRKTPYELELVVELLENDYVKEALGVNKSVVWEACSRVVADALQDDVMKSVRFMVEDILKKKTRVLLYQGQFDLQDGVVSNEAWIKKMKWNGLERFLNADRKVWEVKGEVAGYVQTWGALSEVVVSGAGHPVPADQAVNSQALIQDWVLQRGLFEEN
ncbi:hypothetical protein Sjap_024849 [Stephania japonica]|uniref:Carboxypeptidase n=1 Tax=Stephania japonica TaxID=461633 RepID=A0AAP0EHC6_9MAGN